MSERNDAGGRCARKRIEHDTRLWFFGFAQLGFQPGRPWLNGEPRLVGVRPIGIVVAWTGKMLPYADVELVVWGLGCTVHRDDAKRELEERHVDDLTARIARHYLMVEALATERGLRSDEGGKAA